MKERSSDNRPSKSVRRSHRKSRAGCGNCKRRRIKCDEKKPICSNCTDRALECTFSINTTSEFITRLPETKSLFRSYTFSPHSFKENDEKGASSVGEEYQGVSTNSVGVQCNFDVPSTRYISLDDLHLFHHFTISTYSTISDDASSRELWQMHVPQWGINFPSIQHLILAISALHLFHEFPSRRDVYVRKADNHFTFGLQSVTAVLGYLNSQTCQQVYISTMLICFVYFGRGPRIGEYLVFSDHGPSEWRVLMNGVKLIVESYRGEVFTGVLGPRPRAAATCVDSSLQCDEMDIYVEHLQEVRLLIQQNLQESDVAMYDSIIDDLLTVMAEVDQKRSVQWPPVGLMQILIGWAYRLPDEFVNHLEQKEPMALVILAYWAMLLKYMQSVWLMKGWDVHVMGGIRACLQDQFHGWIEWPVQQLDMV